MHVLSRPLLGRLLAACTALAFATVPAFATNYYVDSVNGQDTNAGTSATTAWQSLTHASTIMYQPGDHIYLARGSHWTGQMLVPAQSGSSTAANVIDAYGTGARPYIEVQGAHEAGVDLVNVEYWEVNNLEISNTDGNPSVANNCKLQNGTGPDSDGTQNWSGIRVYNHGMGPQNHIYIRANYIHDVDGCDIWSGDNLHSKRTGGINVWTVDDTYSDPSLTKYNDIRIENNTIVNVSMDAISVQAPSKKLLYANRNSATDTGWNPFTDVIVDGNLISNPLASAPKATDSIQLIGVQTGHIYNNIVHGGSCVGIELDYDDSILVEHNEISLVTYIHINNGGSDQGGLDFDVQDTNIVAQYNYIHDNGAGLLLYNGSGLGRDGNSYVFGVNNVLRFNLLANNDYVGVSGGNYRGNYALYNGSGTFNIYNNTAVEAAAVSPVFVYGGSAPIAFTNNLFRGDNTAFYGHSGSGLTYTNNSYYNLTSLPADSHSVTGDPQLLQTGGTDAGSVPGSWPGGVYLNRIAYSAPVKGAGTAMPSVPNASTLTLDFFNNTIPSTPNIGFDQGNGGVPGTMTLNYGVSYPTSFTAASGANWSPDETYFGYEGAYALTVPDTGNNYAAMVNWATDFIAAVNWYTHTRGYGANENGDSFHLSLDGNAPQAQSTNISFATDGSWQYDQGYYTNPGFAPSYLSPTAAAHTLNLVDREDGTRIDKITLTTDASYIPEIAATGCTPSAAINGHTWVLDTTYGGYYGTGALYGSPDNGGQGGTPANNAYFTCAVNFPTSGTYYVWLHGYGIDLNGDSASVGYGTAAPVDLGLPSDGSWVWTNVNGTSAPATINVTAAGAGTIRVYMREDGARVDKIFLTKAANQDPHQN